MLKKKIHEPFLNSLSAVCGSAIHFYLPTPNSIPQLELAADYWSDAALISSQAKYRFVSIWAQDLITQLELNLLLELHGVYLLLRTKVAADKPEINSVTPFYPAAARLERHTHDMFGVEFINHPDMRRWTRHQAWNENQFPLRKNFARNSNLATPTSPDNDYPFLPVSGSGIYEIPVGPVHAGIIEPGHFRFHVAGEDVIKLEEHLGYVHKGIEKIAEGREIEEVIRLAARVSGDTTVAHTWAAAQACETALNLKVTDRALFLRAIFCERERVANHLGDFAAICNDVAYSFAYYQLMRLKELWLRLNHKIFGHRLLMDRIVVGGVEVDLHESAIAEMKQQLQMLKQELAELYPIFEASSTLHDRLKTTGILTPEVAQQLGVLGYVGRASGIRFDLRRDAPNAPYDQFKIKVPVYDSGDVLARVRVRAQEILIALELLEQLLDKLPDGEIKISYHYPDKVVEGIGLIEGWRGEVMAFVRLGSDGLVERYFPRDPSWFSWPALEQLIHGNIVPDFPVCNKSINGSYSGVDL